jgi:SAM-dependent methyltransferase
MDDFSTCNLCFKPGTAFDAIEKRKVRCHLRALSHLHFNVWRCANCLSLHCLEAVDLDEFYALYPFRAQKLDAGTRVVYANRLALLKVRAGLKKEHSLLDFGSGQGLFVTFLKSRGFRNAFAFDPYVEEKADENLLSRQYDLITAQDVLEHVDDPIDTLRALRESLKPGGVLVVGTPNAEGIDLRQSLKYANELHQPYHRHIPSERALRGLLEHLGFSDIFVHKRYYFDTTIPTVNTRFINEYTLAKGGVAEALIEPPNWQLLLRKPMLVYYALAGYFLPGEANMVFFCRK